MKKITLLGGTLSLIASSLLFSTNLWAADKYVSDMIYIPVRSDKNPQASILQQGVASGTKLQVIREEAGTDNNLWTLVITPEGTEGWVRSQNLSDKPTAAMQLAKLSTGTRDQVALQAENTQLKQQLEKVQQEHQQLLSDTEDMRQAATTAINLEDDNQRIHREFQILQTRADVLQAENDQLKDADRFNHWIYGGALVFAGVLMSFFLQAIGRRKRQSEWR